MTNHICPECGSPAGQWFDDGQWYCHDHHNIRVDAALNEQERKGKEEFDTIHERYLPWIEEIRDYADEVAAHAAFRDDAEERLQEESENARAYIRRLNHYFELSCAMTTGQWDNCAHRVDTHPLDAPCSGCYPELESPSESLAQELEEMEEL